MHASGKCARTMIHRRSERLDFGARDIKTDAVGSLIAIARHQARKQWQMTEWVLGERCSW